MESYVDPERSQSTRVSRDTAKPEQTAAVAFRLAAMTPANVLRLQRSVGNAGTLQLLAQDRTEESEPQNSPVHSVINSAGEPLDGPTRADMESTLGQDFSDVRVHRDSVAHDSAQEMAAKAYTVGNHVVFQRDAYDPASESGRHTLVHELSHVVQQRSGPVAGTPGPGGVRVSDPSDSFEREASAIADAAASMTQPTVTSAGEPGSAVVSREVDTDEEEVQTYVQRSTETDEEPGLAD